MSPVSKSNINVNYLEMETPIKTGESRHCFSLKHFASIMKVQTSDPEFQSCSLVSNKVCIARKNLMRPCLFKDIALFHIRF